ncbi:receptor-like protein eix2 [Quercus suber]|uniref:Receptor-like protein eix2 n=1 Tax=Quercus suber TaxID=58331 RepID=A0AAW0J1N8_QUESU
MASKASIADQQSQLQENFHAQIKSFSVTMDEILIPDTKRIAAPCWSGLRFVVRRNGQPTDYLGKCRQKKSTIGQQSGGNGMVAFRDGGDLIVTSLIPSHLKCHTRKPGASQGLYLNGESETDIGAGQLPRLSANVEVLNLANNSFFGHISTFLCQKMSKINKLKLLRGYFFIIEKCSKLGLIDIGDNHFLETIPLWITKVIELIVLCLRSSGFKGNITLNICQISSLRILDLANNSLLGSIPSYLKNIYAKFMPNSKNEDIYFDDLEYEYDYESYIENLMLAPNGYELEYEDNLKFMKMIDLLGNKLFGSIPIEIFVLFELTFFNLSRNHLMANILEKIGIMKELESIDLSRNHLLLKFLQVRIPSSTQLQYFDVVRYIGNPQLCGDPLPKYYTLIEECHD